MSGMHEFEDPSLARGVLERIRSLGIGHVRLMEFCGSHTAAILKAGLRQLLPPDVELLSGPGCPVCVTHQDDIDRMIAMAKLPGVIICTFGDMIRVPGSRSSLAEASAEGADIRTVYSTLDAIEIARQNPSRLVIFIGVGFETTAPTIAASILQAKAGGITNYRVFSLAKTCPPVITALLDSGEINIDGIILPGHVSSVIGSLPFEFIPKNYGIACAVSGFESVDILLAIEMILSQIKQKQPSVEIAYPRFVDRQGNIQAQNIMNSVFQPVAATWRGFGEILGSGLAVGEDYADFDAARDSLAASASSVKSKPDPGCLCGDVLRGAILPMQCPRFGGLCTPQNPLGPCMVSSEGTCSSYYMYGAQNVG